MPKDLIKYALVLKLEDLKILKILIQSIPSDMSKDSIYLDFKK